MSAEFAPRINDSHLIEWKHSSKCTCGYQEEQPYSADCLLVATVTEKCNFTEDQQLTYEWLLAIQEAEERRAEYNTYEVPDYDDTTMVHNTTPSTFD